MIVPCVGLTTALLLFPAAHSVPSHAVSTFRDPASCVVIHYPASWHRDPLPKAILTIDSFPERHRPAQLLVPLGGAFITISQEVGPALADVIKANALTTANGYRRRQVMIETTAGTIPAEEFKAEPAVFPEGFCTIHVFTIKGRIYKTELFYRGAKSKAKFEATYHEVIRTMEFPKD